MEREIATMTYKSRLFTILLCLMPILHPYASPLPNITLGELGLLLLAPFGIIDYLTTIKKMRYSSYFLFVSTMLLTTLISLIIQSENNVISSIQLFSRLIFYFTLISIVGKVYFDFFYAIRIYKLICIIASIYLILQTISFYLFNLVLPSTLQFLPLYKNEAYQSINFTEVYARLFRPQSFFLEPGVFSQYILVGLIACLFKINKFQENRNLNLAIFFSFSLILSLSAQGIIITLIIWIIWFLFGLNNLKLSKKLLILYFGVIGTIVLFFLILNIEPLRQATLGRFVYGTSYDSTNVRVVRGFQVYGNLDDIYKLIGVGFGNITIFVLKHGITTANDLYAQIKGGVVVYNYEYMNAMAYVLVSSGVIGFVTFLNLFWRLFTRSVGFSKVCLIILAILSFIGGTLISPTWVVFMTFIYSGINYYYIEEYKRDLIIDGSIKS
jgi:hypothetical protein